MPRKIADAVVVITGASSGIGRAAALQFAARGAMLVLAARRVEALQDVARECESLGARALVVRTDVTREDEVQNLARQAIATYGRIDVWVNNAAVTLFARVEEAPTEAIRRVVETNLFGYIHGTRAALPHMREQGSGVLICVDSVVASAPQPYTSAYVITKAGVRALADCLRMELALDDAKNIHVCTVMPASIDTPLFQQAANYTGRAARALEPVYRPEDVAAAIVKLAQHPKREVIVGTAGRLAAGQHALAPGVYERVAARHIDRNHFQSAPCAPTPGNLYEPMPQYARVHGGWQTERGARGRKLAAAAGLALFLPLALFALQRMGTRGLRA